MTCPDAESEAAERAALPEPVRRHLEETVLPLCGRRPDDPVPPLPDLAGRRIGFFRRNLRRGGSARVMIEQMAALSAAGARVDLYHFEPESDADVLAEIRTRCPKLLRLRHVSRRLLSWRTLALELWPRRHDLFISTDIHDPFIFAGTVARYRIMRPPRVAAVMHEEYDRYLRFLQPHVGRMAAACLDYDFMGRFRALYGDDMPASVVAPLFPLPEAVGDGADLRRKLDIPPESRVLAYAGRLDRNKRIERALFLLEDLLTEGRDAWLLLAGRWESEDYRRELRALMARDIAGPGGRTLRLGDRVREAGPVPSLGSVFAAADLFVFPSRTEGFYPLVVMEAQQAGLPVLCTGAGGLGRIILDGVTGSLAPTVPGPEGVEFPPDGRAAFAARAGHLLDDPAAADSIGRAGARLVNYLTRRYPFVPLFLQWVQRALDAGKGTA